MILAPAGAVVREVLGFDGQEAHVARELVLAVQLHDRDAVELREAEDGVDRDAAERPRRAGRHGRVGRRRRGQLVVHDLGAHEPRRRRLRGRGRVVPLPLRGRVPADPPPAREPTAGPPRGAYARSTLRTSLDGDAKFRARRRPRGAARELGVRPAEVDVELRDAQRRGGRVPEEPRRRFPDPVRVEHLALGDDAGGAREAVRVLDEPRGPRPRLRQDDELPGRAVDPREARRALVRHTFFRRRGRAAPRRRGAGLAARGARPAPSRRAAGHNQDARERD